MGPGVRREHFPVPAEAFAKIPGKTVIYRIAIGGVRRHAAKRYGYAESETVSRFDCGYQCLGLCRQYAARAGHTVCVCPAIRRIGSGTAEEVRDGSRRVRSKG